MNEEETIAIIRSLLTSSKVSLDLNALNTDFKNEIGSDIPLFGYKNLGEFLRSSPENFMVVGKYPNEVVKLITNNKSSHIVSLVQKQKTANSKNKYKNELCYKKYYPSNFNCSIINEDDKAGHSNSNLNTSESVEENLIDYLMKCPEGFGLSNSNLNTSESVEENLIDFLMKCPDGASFEDIQKNIKVFETWESKMRMHNIIAFTKKFPKCVFYEGKFYTVELFKSKIDNNKTI